MVVGFNFSAINFSLGQICEIRRAWSPDQRQIPSDPRTDEHEIFFHVVRGFATDTTDRCDRCVTFLCQVGPSQCIHTRAVGFSWNFKDIFFEETNFKDIS